MMIDPLSNQPTSFYGDVRGAKVLPNGDVMLTVIVPAGNKYEALALTDTRDKLWQFNCEPPELISDMDQLEALLGGHEDYDPQAD